MVQRTNFRAMACSMARAWAVVGEPWTPLILRDLAFGLARFDDIRAHLGVARNVLSDRLSSLEAAGVVARREYQSANRTRFEYVLTEMGRDFVPIAVAIAQWGDRWLDDGAGPPMSFQHSCGAMERAEIVCDGCRRELTASEVYAFPGPGALDGWDRPQPQFAEDGHE